MLCWGKGRKITPPVVEESRGSSRLRCLAAGGTGAARRPATSPPPTPITYRLAALRMQPGAFAGYAVFHCHVSGLTSAGLCGLGRAAAVSTCTCHWRVPQCFIWGSALMLAAAVPTSLVAPPPLLPPPHPGHVLTLLPSLPASHHHPSTHPH